MKDYIFLKNKLLIYFVPIQEIVWIYKNEDGNSSGDFINQSRKKYLYIVTQNHMTIGFPLGKMNNSGEEKSFIQKIIDQKPSIIQGFYQNNRNMYNHNFKMMIDIANEKKERKK